MNSPRPEQSGVQRHGPQVTADGQVRLELRQPWRDGTTDVVFDPVDCLARLAVLAPWSGILCWSAEG
jgi:hypothetical protein